MNIFLPYEDDIVASVQSLDDKRLNKQILECYQLIRISERLNSGEIKVGYINHPIYQHYKDYIPFVKRYGWECCKEYFNRFYNWHKLNEWFYKNRPLFDGFNYIPFYMQGSKNSADCIRTTIGVSELYQKRLCDKWNNDAKFSRAPKWTNSPIPEFYKKHIETQKT